jgi:hypothetical protein
MYTPKNGYGFVSEYQVSALPYVTNSIAGNSTTTRIMFPFVTRFLTVKNTGVQYLKVGFTNNGVLNGGNSFLLAPSGSYTGEWRVKDLFLLSAASTTTFEVVAGLTSISRNDAPFLSGSGAVTSSINVVGYNGLG